MEFDFTRLHGFLSEVLQELYSISNELEPVSRDQCEEEALAEIRTSVQAILQRKAQELDVTIGQCRSLIDEIAEKCELLGSPELVPSMVLASPYKPFLATLTAEIGQIDALYNTRVQRRSKAWSTVCTVSSELRLEHCDMPDSLAESVIAALEANSASLQALKAAREEQVRELSAEITSLAHALNEPTTAPCCELDDESISRLKAQRDSVAEKHRLRSEEAESLTRQIETLAKILEVESSLPQPTGGHVLSECHLQALRDRLAEVQELKRHKLDLFVGNARTKIQQLWDELYLDTALRNAFLDVPVSEDLLTTLEAEMTKLGNMTLNSDRQTVIEALERYMKIREIESELKALAGDTDRLSRRGFAQTLRKEEMMRNFVQKNKQERVKEALRLVKQWASTHNGETFQVGDVKFLDLLEEDALSLQRGPRASLARKRSISPAVKHSAASSSVKRLKPTPRPASRPAQSAKPFSPPISRPRPATAHALLNRSTQGKTRTATIAAPRSAAMAARTQAAVKVRTGTERNIIERRDKITANGKPVTSTPDTRRVVSSTSARTLAPPRIPRAVPQRSAPFQQQKREPLKPLSASRANSARLPNDPIKKLANGQGVVARTASVPQLTLSESAVVERVPTPSPTGKSRDSWEHEQLQLMKTMEMSYFDESSMHETTSHQHEQLQQPARQHRPSIGTLHEMTPSFDYDRDAF